jgi:hypothetical protein
MTADDCVVVRMTYVSLYVAPLYALERERLHTAYVERERESSDARRTSIRRRYYYLAVDDGTSTMMFLPLLLAIFLSSAAHQSNSLQIVVSVTRPVPSDVLSRLFFRRRPQGVFFNTKKSSVNRIILSSRGSSSSTSLYIGRGVAKHYRWKEEPNEIEVTVKVPANTRTKDILFKVTPTTVDLRYNASSSLGNKNNDDDAANMLLSGERTLRGKVCIDGTFWSISDNPPDREVTVTMEKNKRKGEFEVETDWEGVFVDDDDEVIFRDYKEPEELDVRDYCKRELKVDIGTS